MWQIHYVNVLIPALFEDRPLKMQPKFVLIFNVNFDVALCHPVIDTTLNGFAIFKGAIAVSELNDGVDIKAYSQTVILDPADELNDEDL